MKRLADVELQLIMHGLSVQEILTLAQCSRYLLHAADAPFAWRYTRLCLEATNDPPPPISLSQRILGWVRRRIAPQVPGEPGLRILRHAKVTLRCTRRAVKDGHLAILATASRVPALYELDLSNYYGSQNHDHLNLLLGSPSMQQLRVLCLYNETMVYNPSTANAIVQLSHLHTLRLPASPYHEDAESGAWDHGFLSQAPALTDLHIQDTFTTLQSPSRLSHVAECSKLTALSVSCPSLYDPSSWANFFAHPHIQQLRSLKLDNLYVQWFQLQAPFTLQYFAVAFETMRHLHTLHLVGCHEIDLLLPALVHAPVLRMLNIEPYLSRHTTIPSPLVIAELLATSSSNLHCVLTLRSAGQLFEEVYNIYRQETERWVQQLFEANAILVNSTRFTISI